DGVKQLVDRYRASRDSSNPLAAYQEALAGGSVEEGRRLFFQKAEVYCVRCHKAGGVGGDVGPDLSHIGKDKSREYLLEAIVTPNAAVAKGFNSVTLMLDDGRVVSGIVREETDEQLRLITPEGQ